MDATALFEHVRLVPVVVIEAKESAVDLAKALRDAGIKAIEVTLRTADALAAIELIAAEVPDIIAGAGSVRRVEHFAQIRERGARFAVSPGASPALVDAATDANMPFVPGAETASEMIALFERGYSLQKFFPAELSGGIAKLRALSAPLPEVRFFPTGGINGDLAPGYLGLAAVSCIGGSWFIRPEALRAGDFSLIYQEAKEAMIVCDG